MLWSSLVFAQDKRPSIDQKSSSKATGATASTKKGSVSNPLGASGLGTESSKSLGVSDQTVGGMGRGSSIAPKVRVGRVVTRGECPKQDIIRAVKIYDRRLRNCLKKRTKEQQGKLVLKWALNRQGKVENAKVTQSTIKDRKIDRCLMKELKRIRFPKGAGAHCLVQIPLVVTPQ